mmetsp:Transcript_93165/g.260517  ORF Transcript_93165/g.260517 Transcript_93165/m.260517 type:complete len:239 (+) Transcript_93165:559-1275(+)
MLGASPRASACAASASERRGSCLALSLERFASAFCLLLASRCCSKRARISLALYSSRQFFGRLTSCASTPQKLASRMACFAILSWSCLLASSCMRLRRASTTTAATAASASRFRPAASCSSRKSMGLRLACSGKRLSSPSCRSSDRRSSSLRRLSRATDSSSTCRLASSSSSRSLRRLAASSSNNWSLVSSMAASRETTSSSPSSRQVSDERLGCDMAPGFAGCAGGGPGHKSFRLSR